MNDFAKAALEEVSGLITSERAKVYGPYEDECKRSSKIASEITGLDIKPEHIPLILIAVKMSREANMHKRDNLIDMIGYTALYEQLIDGPSSVVAQRKDG